MAAAPSLRKSFRPAGFSGALSRRRRRLSTVRPVGVQIQAAAVVPPSHKANGRALAGDGLRSVSEVVNPRFDVTGLRWAGPGGSNSPPDPNKAKLGKTLRRLQERLPTLLVSPLPHDMLAPNISLHLFPSTHPHLPTVSGRVAYNAAVWTSPIAWNRVPIIGSVRIEILAERMTSEPLTFLPRRPGAIPEQLVVRWREKRHDSPVGAIARALPFFDKGVDKAFTGLFIFDFDTEGRILSHTIEHAQANSDCQDGVGSRFVGLTDWLLGGMKGPGDAPIPMFEAAQKSRHN